MILTVLQSEYVNFQLNHKFTTAFGRQILMYITQKIADVEIALFLWTIEKGVTAWINSL